MDKMQFMWKATAAVALIAACSIGAAAQTIRQVSLVITNGIVVTVNNGNRIINPGAVAIDGTDIVAVDTAENVRRQFRGRQTIDAAGQVVMPGLVNTHTHAPMVLYRGLADDLALDQWLTKYIFPAEAKTVSPEFVRAGTRLAALEMIESGTTTYADMRRVVGEEMGVKAAGGVRDLESLKAMVAAGATRVGASAGVRIVQESRGTKPASAGKGY